MQGTLKKFLNLQVVKTKMCSKYESMKFHSLLTSFDHRFYILYQRNKYEDPLVHIFFPLMFICTNETLVDKVHLILV